MSAPKGNNNNPNGRPVGAVNKSTAHAREAISKFVDGNAERLSEWVEQIAKGTPLVDRDGTHLYDKEDQTPRYIQRPDPQAAFNCLMSVVEYHIPKLARQELVGKDGEQLQINIINLGDNPEALEKLRLQMAQNAVKHKE